METTYLKINPADNVAVAITPLKAGETIRYGICHMRKSGDYTTCTD